MSNVHDTLIAAFAGTIHAVAVATAQVSDFGRKGYRITLASEDQREAAFSIARHVISAFGADPESAPVNVLVFGRIVEVRIDDCEPGEISDADALDQLAEFMNRPGQWNGGDVCELAAKLLTMTGRKIDD